MSKREDKNISKDGKVVNLDDYKNNKKNNKVKYSDVVAHILARAKLVKWEGDKDD